MNSFMKACSCMQSSIVRKALLPSFFVCGWSAGSEFSVSSLHSSPNVFRISFSWCSACVVGPLWLSWRRMWNL